MVHHLRLENTELKRMLAQAPADNDDNDDIEALRYEVERLTLENADLQALNAQQAGTQSMGSPTASEAERVQDAVVAQLEQTNHDLQVELELLQVGEGVVGGGCPVLPSLAQSCSVLLSLAQSCLVLLSLAQSCLVLSRLAQSCPVLPSLESLIRARVG